MQQPVGEDVAALGVAAQLDLVDGQEVDGPVERHAFDRADEPLGIRRDDLLFAGDQGDGVLALQLGDAVVILAGQQAQRKADHAGAVPEHALQGEMGLAGVGRAENGHHPAAVMGTGHR